MRHSVAVIPGDGIVLERGSMMDEDGLERLREHEAIFLGAVGHPEVPDHVSLWGLLISIRRNFRVHKALLTAERRPTVEAD